MYDGISWALVFLLFWSSAPNNFASARPFRYLFFFPDHGIIRTFEVQKAPGLGFNLLEKPETPDERNFSEALPPPETPEIEGETPSSDILLERANPCGRVLSKIRTRSVFKLFFSDIDNDSKKDLIVGVTRKINGRTYRRIYIYETSSPGLRAKWLSSRLSYKLVDFEVVETPRGVRIKTKENRLGRRFDGWYAWDQWGFRTIQKKE